MSFYRRWKQDLLIGGVLFVASALLFATQGIGLSWDSNYYLLFSQSMRLNLDFSTQGIYAPLYPMLLAALTTVGASTDIALVLVQSASLAVIYLASSRLMRAAQLPLPLPMFGGTYVALSALGSMPFQFAWTEVPYTALLSVCILVTVVFWARPAVPSVWWFFPIGLLAPLRFIGLVPALLLAGVMGWRLLLATDALSIKLRRLAAGMALAAGPAAIVGAANAVAWGCAFGCRAPSNSTLMQNLSLTSSSLWLDAGKVAGGVLLLTASLPLKMLWPRLYPDVPSRRIVHEWPAWLAWAVPAAVTVVSVSAQVYASTRSDIDPINPRYFAPLYPAVGVLTIVAAWQVMQRYQARVLVVTFSVALASIVLISSYQDLVMYAGLVRDAADPDASLSDFGFKRSPMRRQWREAQSALLAEGGAGSIATYFASPDGSANPSAYLALESAYGPKGAKCRPGAIQTSADGGTRIRLDCPGARDRKYLDVTVISSLAHVPAEAELLIVDKTGIDSTSGKTGFDVEGFQVIAESTSHRILRRQP